jgi:hypothetical protein
MVETSVSTFFILEGDRLRWPVWSEVGHPAVLDCLVNFSSRNYVLDKLFRLREESSQSDPLIFKKEPY